ncbi:MAG: class I SAM-dependent methyltransferase [Acidimicrobiales bacterium]
MATCLPDAGTEAGAEVPFAGLEAAYDSVSRRHLVRTGVGPGWHCWEVGAGGGSVAGWLADRVGPTGSVLATDIDPSLMPPDPRPNLSVVRHDLVVDPLPTGSFRGIHVRLVLGHLPDRGDLLARLASALVPGGWLVVEDLELVLPPCPEGATPDQRLVHGVRSGFSELLRELREDGDWARGLPRRLRRLGLVDVAASAHVAPVSGGSIVASVERAHLAGVGDELVNFGVVTQAGLDRCLQLLDDPAFRFTMPPMVSARGRRRPPPCSLRDLQQPMLEIA